MKWDTYGLSLARTASEASKDPSTQVGAYISDQFNRSVSTGFNGPPRGISDEKWQQADRDLKLKATIHAEANAILFANRDRLIGSTIYITHPPCSSCAAFIVQAGITRVVYPKPNDAFVSRWGTDGIDILLDANITVTEL
jgi:dCMP deaminase